MIDQSNVDEFWAEVKSDLLSKQVASYLADCRWPDRRREWLSGMKVAQAMVPESASAASTEPDSCCESMSSASSPPLLEVRHVSKQFAGVRALDDVSLTLDRGEVLAVVGENGAGKSTLMRIVAGVETPSAGEILVDGQPVQFTSIAQALNLGISLIHQELNLADNLSVGANIFLGSEPSRFGLIDQAAIDRESRKYLDMVGLDVDPQTIVSTLPIGKQQLVEIAKALSTNARILIMDEPTSSLSEHEADKLFDVVRELAVARREHHVYFAPAARSRTTGRSRGRAARRKIQRPACREREQSAKHDPPDDRPRCVAFLSAHAAHAGRRIVERQRTCARRPIRSIRSVFRCVPAKSWASPVWSAPVAPSFWQRLFGVTPAVSGSMTIGPLRRPPHTVREAIAAGIMLAPEDRRHTGLILPMSVKTNLSLASLRRDQRTGRAARISQRSRPRTVLPSTMIELMRIKTSNDRQVVRYLSGGNQQKVVLGKWLCLEPEAAAAR